ncbi:hypothetical protein [Nocardia brasiliensis]|uniref:hypothetical protein n=1 Tax=Nocardia brasiliensis TaxID=37326 RepID=UPI002454199C|nr:hypothetical protein [Nocardia brasiliensis]
MDSSVRAYGIVRGDMSGELVAAHVDALRRLATELGFDLRAIRVDGCGDADFGVLLATLRPSLISVLLVPSILHVTGWLDAIRQDTTVWSLDPRGHWPRLTRHRAAAEFVPVAGSL